MRTGEKVKISPELTGFENWLEGSVIEIENNRFNGIVISMKANDGSIFFGQERYFVTVSK